MIVGTAGHIDHGKTTLVRALTGVDTDRLPEEKQRGISIELGYAFLDLPGGGRLGFIDVPGHERLVHTMLAGATGIDHALLLVAADDGVMPQTREHLAVLALLGLDRATVVLTKTDRADAARCAAVEAEVRALLAPTALAGAPCLRVSALQGEGLDALRAHLLQQAEAGGRPRPRDAGFRLAIDRVFSLGGVGTVATGTVHAGQVRVGDSLAQVPEGRLLRVRSVHAQNRAVEAAEAGQRCALGLAGVEREALARGDWLVAPELAFGTSRLDAALTVWAGESAPLRSGQAVQVHLGAAACPARVAVLEPAQLAPGERGWVQLVLQRPIGAWQGDRLVLRDASASRTLAGGLVLDPLAPTRHRRSPARLAELAVLGEADPAVRLAGLLAQAEHGLDLRRHAAASGRALPPGPLAAAGAPAALRSLGAGGDWALGPAQAEAAAARVLARLDAFHAQNPDEAGPDSARLRRLAVPRLPEPLWQALLARLEAEGQVQRRGAGVQRPAHGVRLSAAEQKLAEALAPALHAAGAEGAWVRDLARDHGLPEALTRLTLARLAQRGELHQVVKDLYMAPATLARLGALVRELAARDGEVGAARFRDACGLGRKRAIQILEHFDRIGLLRRVGDQHRLRPDCTLFLPDPPLADRP